MARFTFVLCSLVFAAAAAAESGAGIHVTGRGEALVEPDMARFTFEIVRQGSDAAALKRDVDTVTAKVVALAEKSGVVRADITAAVIQVRPEYRYSDGRSILEGVTVSRTVRVELKRLAQYATLTNGAIAAGVNQIQGVELDVADRGRLERTALEAAVDRAQADATLVAAKLGMQVGRALEVSVVSGGGDVPQFARMAMEKTGDSFRPGTMSIQREVNVRFELIAPASTGAGGP